MKNKNIELIVFDLSEVIISGLIESLQVISDFESKSVGLDSFKKDNLESFFLGYIKLDAFLKLAIQDNGWKIDVETLDKIIKSNFKEIDSMFKLVKDLRRKTKIICLSNHSMEWIEYIEKKFSLISQFDECFFSFDLELLKPNPLIYKKILSLSNTSPDKVLFIDDNLLNVSEARKVGINAILFSGRKNLENKIKFYEFTKKY